MSFIWDIVQHWAMIAIMEMWMALFAMSDECSNGIYPYELLWKIWLNINLHASLKYMSTVQ